MKYNVGTMKYFLVGYMACGKTRRGKVIAEEQGVTWLPSDFKKRNGYKRSVELSEEYGMYRQNYCGCIFSKREREEKQ